jgi:NDP-sugar pyrophosphorylase family protein
MHALVLTAGLGTRLDPLTRLVAKPAVPLGDRTLVEHVIAWLQRQAITDLVLNLHHRPSTITAVVGDGRHLGVRVRYSWEQPLLGSAGGPRRALPLLDSDPFLIVNGDTLCDFDLAPLLAAHAASGAEVTMAVVPNPRPEHYNGIAADEMGRVIGFVRRGEKNTDAAVQVRSSKFEVRNSGMPAESHDASGGANALQPFRTSNFELPTSRSASWHFVGVQVAQARVFAGLRDGEPAETVAGLYREMVAARPGAVRVWPAPTTFLDVGTPRDYLEAALRLGGDRRHPPAAAVSARLARTVVWPGARVGDGAVLDDCIVAAGADVPAGFEARGAILAPASMATSSEAAAIRGGLAVFPIDAPRS